MKILTTILLSVSFLNNGFSQDTLITFTDIKNVDSLSKGVIFDRVKLWSVEGFRRVDGSMQVDDREMGLLAYDAYIRETSPNAPNVTQKKDAWKLTPYVHSYRFKMKIQIKDNKYKIDLIDIRLIEGDESFPITSSKKAPYTGMFVRQSKLNGIWADEKLTFENFARTLFTSVEKAVRKSDDW